MKKKECFQVCVAGNPNSGKSTLINALAGSHLTVGNWPGVTVEKKEALLKLKDCPINIVDLPGIYSLRSYTEEERVARDYLIQSPPSVLIQVLDSTNLERHLILTMQLIELKIPMILVLNFFDEAVKKQISINLKHLEKSLGVKVITAVATKGKGINEITNALQEIHQSNFTRYIPNEIHFSKDLEKSLSILEKYIKTIDIPYNIPKRMTALMALENILPDSIPIDRNSKEFKSSTYHFEKAHDDSIDNIVRENRFAAANGLYRQIIKTSSISRADITDKIDSFLLNNFIGIPLFLAIMWMIFKVTFDVSTPFVEWLEFSTSRLSIWITSLMTSLSMPDWLISLTTEGVISGVTSILVFTPVIFFMMMALTFLEASGYLARAAFLMDKTMHVMGLHGKSFIPMVLGFGCNVPSVYATRILESKRDKILTSLLSPLMSCSARLPVYILFAGIFFPKNSGTVIFSIYLLGIGAAFLMGFIFKKTLFQGISPEFIMELPPYRIPSLKSLYMHTWEKVKHFIIKAGTSILAFSILLWFFFHLPLNSESKKDSYFGRTSQTLSVLFEPIGIHSWEGTAAILSGIIAKEVVVSTFAEIASPHDENQNEKIHSFQEESYSIISSFGIAVQKAAWNLTNIFAISSIDLNEKPKEMGKLRRRLTKIFDPLSAYAFMIFILLYTPCMIFLIAMKNEFGSWKWPLLSIIYQFILAWLAAFTIYQVGSLFI